MTVFHVDDTFARLPDIPTDSADVTITDPPYSEHVQANLCSGSLVGTKAVPKYELPFDPIKTYDWLHELVRITKRWVVVFCAFEDFGRFEMTVRRPTYVRSCAWVKPNAMGQLTADRPATAYEGVALLHSPTVKKRWNGRGSWGVWLCNGTRGKKDRHPNEKPIDLALKLTALFSNRGERIFDPFCGSGVFGEAAKRLGRTYVGWDNNPIWAGRALERELSATDPVTDEDALKLCRLKEPVARPVEKA